MASRLHTLYETVWPPLPVWQRLDAAVLLVCAYTAGVEFFTHQVRKVEMPGSAVPLTVLNGLLLTVLLQFRNSQAYDRWWEGRKLWGQLINDCRNLCLKAAALGPADPAERQAFGRLVVGFAVALKNRLRGRPALALVPGFETDPATPPHAPAYLAGQVFATLRRWRGSGGLTDIDYLTADGHAKALMDVSGACERIQSSPVPLSYRSLTRHGTVLYLASAPWFLPHEFGYLGGVAVVGLLAYFLLGIELTAEDVEEPFGKDGDDLALGKYCETIRASAEQILEVDLGYGDLAQTVGEVRAVG